MSQAQLNEFRKVSNESNFRPTQPLNGRTVSLLCRRTIDRSTALPRHLKSFLQTFTGYLRSASDYEAVWASQTTLGIA